MYAVQAFRRFPSECLVGKQQKDPLVMRRLIEGAIMYHLLEKHANGYAQKQIIEDKNE